MSKLIKTVLIIAISLFGCSLSLTSAPIYAAVDCSTVPDELKESAGCKSTANEGALPAVVTNIINAVVGILGVVAVIFVVIGGIQYMTSGGDSGKVKNAKNTILYALIGLVICVLAFAIVNWGIGVINSIK